MLARTSIATALILLVFSAQPGRSGSLHEAAKAGQLDTLKSLLVKTADLEALDADGETPLTAAALADQIAAVQLLVAQGADINGRNAGGFTALHAAAYTGHTRIVEFALDHGAGIDDQNNKAKITPLHAAAERNHLETAALLLDRGARIDLKELNGWTPLARASFKRYKEMVIMLRTHGAQCPPLSAVGAAHYGFCQDPAG